MRQGTGWQDQWYRILRWRERVRQSRDDGRSDALGTEGYRDEVFALFQAMWHLKDWLKNDPSFEQLTGVEDWIVDHSSALLVAADVANGSKHMTLSNPRAHESGQTRNDVHIHVGAWVKHTFYVTDNRPLAPQDYEALHLADLCLREWTDYLRLCQVPVPPPPESGVGAGGP